MHKGQLKVTLVDEIVDLPAVAIARLNLLKVYLGYRTCYSKDTDPLKMVGCGERHIELVGHTPAEVDAAHMSVTKMEKLIADCVASGHEAELEHGTLTFHVSGVSRALTHQQVRHRLASYGQQSQRYVKMDDLEVIIPPSIENHENPEVLSRFTDLINQIEDYYSFAISQGIKPEDARYVTPQAATSAITISMNFRSLRNLFSLRCCNRAQWEIRNLASQMLDICQRYYPVIFADSGAKCIHLGKCPEGKHMCAHPQFLELRRALTAKEPVTEDGHVN